MRTCDWCVKHHHHRNTPNRNTYHPQQLAQTNQHIETGYGMVCGCSLCPGTEENKTNTHLCSPCAHTTSATSAPTPQTCTRNIAEKEEGGREEEGRRKNEEQEEKEEKKEEEEEEDEKQERKRQQREERQEAEEDAKEEAEEKEEEKQEGTT